MTTMLIVGGTHGIGLEVARRYAGEAWSVIVAGRDGSHAKSMAAEIGGDTRGIALDLSEPEAVAGALTDLDTVDHIVLSAIIRDTNMIADYDIAAARYLAIMKIVGYTAVVSALRDRLAQDGSVVLFGGRAKDRPYPGSTTVSAVNGGISGMVRTLALQLAPRRVNAIHPGIVADSPYWSEKDDYIAKIREATPTGRNVAIADIIDGVDFLIRNRSANGIDLYIDGGWLLQ
ncbi:MAG TPA: SDR family oxidoreductase [Propionibacteriaceae bacterium]|jgi:NAD(P)-dependent dehydrogenase (short-subunit alcohol dehydrogenase family)